MEFILQLIFGIIFCVPILWCFKLKTDLNIANHQLNFWRNQAIKLNREIKNEKS
tara:strand:- start:358 stop:519 length:162 start_codon:yes stop_codon:yes gene_type:complete